MKADGSILIDTRILDGGMEKGFDVIKNEMASVGIVAKETGDQIAQSFSGLDVSKSISNAASKVKQLEQQLQAVAAEHQLAIADGDDKAGARLGAQMTAVYDRLESAREKLAMEVAASAQKEAAAEEKAAERKIKAAEREAAAEERAQAQQLRKSTKSVRRFGTRLREIISGALVFNLLSSGLRQFTNYIGSVLRTNTQFAQSTAQLKGALLTAFQPIYEVVAPALIYLIRLLTAAAQAVGQLFAALSGKSYSAMQKNAKALNDQAKGLNAVGGAAEEAKKQLMGFDEINRLEDNQQGGGGGGSALEDISPIFSEVEDSGLKNTLLDILQLVTAVGVGLLAWKIASLFTTSLALAAGIAVTIGGALYYAWSWADALTNGISWKNFSKLILGAAAVVGGLAMAFGPLGASIGLVVTGVGLAILALREWIQTGTLSNEACATLASGFMMIGAAIALLTGSWIPLLIAGLVSAVAVIVANWEEISNYFSTTFADGFFYGIQKLGSDIGNWLIGWLSDLINWAMRELSGLVSFFSKFSFVGGETVVNPSAYAATSTYSLRPEVPMLAKGAVIPPNKEFMAVLGDQSNGRNLEAPEDLIRKIVREEAGGDSDRVAQLLEVLIGVVEGIEVGDETIGRAAARYSRRTSRAGGF